jgi:methionine-rich copper-binding protein CopC
MNLRFLTFLAIACSANPSFAHAFLNHADPAAGAAVGLSPKRVVLIFSEKLDPALSGAEVTDQSGRNVEAGAAVALGNSLYIPLRPLPPGKYRVAWHAVSADTHRSEGAYRFAVKP